MPNWCSNSLTVSHEDPKMLDALIQAVEEEKMFAHLVPLPNGEWDYNWCVENWGTKWDAGGTVERIDDNTAVIAFDTAWSPPVGVYQRMTVDQGFQIEAFYFEPGMAFVGKIVGDGEDFCDDYYEYSEYSSDDVREFIGEELDDQWGISDMLAQYEDEDNEG